MVAGDSGVEIVGKLLGFAARRAGLFFSTGGEV